MNIQSSILREIWFLKVFCELGTFVILLVRNICDVFSTKEKSMITNEFTICKTRIELNIWLKAQEINYNLKI